MILKLRVDDAKFALLLSRQHRCVTKKVCRTHQEQLLEKDWEAVEVIKADGTTITARYRGIHVTSQIRDGESIPVYAVPISF